MFERIYNKSHIQQVILYTLFIEWELGSLKLSSGRPTDQPVTVY